jgi:3-oxoacyl-[acyl-carrier-protein] synthase III
MIDWTDRTTAVLFGDGAGAVVLRADSTPGVVSTHLHADGQYKDLLFSPPGWGAACGPSGATTAIQMKGNEVFKVAVNTLGRIVDETLAANGWRRATSTG